MSIKSKAHLQRIIHFRCDTKYNIGDAAVAYSIKDLLSHYLKTSTYTPMDINELKIHNLRWLLPASLVKFRNSEFTNKLLEIAPSSLSKIVSKHGGVLSQSKMSTQYSASPSQLSKMINQYDLCIIGGGGVYSACFLPMNDQLLKSIKIPIVLYGPGNNRDFGQDPLTKAQEESIFTLNKCARLSSVRDLETYTFLERLNIKNVNTIGDPAIFLGSRRTDRIIFNKNKIKIGLNIASHGWTLQTVFLDKVISEYIKTCKFLLKNFNVQIVYLQHDSSEKYVINKLKKKFPIQVANYAPYEMKWVYDNLDLVIGMRLHSSIFAFGSCVPFINVAYNFKNNNFMKLTNQMNRMIDVRDIDSKTLIKIVANTLHTKKEIKNDFKQLKNDFWQKHLLFINNIRSLIGIDSN